MESFSFGYGRKRICRSSFPPSPKAPRIVSKIQRLESKAALTLEFEFMNEEGILCASRIVHSTCSATRLDAVMKQLDYLKIGSVECFPLSYLKSLRLVISLST